MNWLTSRKKLIVANVKIATELRHEKIKTEEWITMYVAIRSEVEVLKARAKEPQVIILRDERKKEEKK